MFDSSLRGRSLSSCLLVAACTMLSGCGGSYPSSTKSYKDAQAEVGCGSKFADSKKERIWSEEYEGHWLTWSGEVEKSTGDEVHLDVDGMATDAIISLSGSDAGGELIEGQAVTIKFLPTERGGCLDAYVGSSGIIVS